MAKWINLPTDPYFENPDQEAFLKALSARSCLSCTNDKGKPLKFRSVPPFGTCPKCGKKGIRLWEHLTIIAGRRWGKSRIGSWAGAQESTINGTIGWACAPSNPKLHRYVIPAFQKLIPSSWVKNYNSEFHDLTLVNGSMIHFQTLEDPDQGRGQGLDWLWIDEVCELSLDHWDVISPSLDDRHGAAFFTTTPRSYDWVYDELYSKAEMREPGFWGLHARTADNPIFQTPEGRARLDMRRRTMSPEMFRQEYEADFVTFTGAIYGSMINPQILKSEEDIKALLPEWPNLDPTRPILIGIDTGADHPFGAVKLVATEKGLVVVGEYLHRDRPYIEHAKALHSLVGSGLRPRWAINKNDRQGMIELGQHQITAAPANNDQVAGIERVKSWLVQNQLWFVASHCPQTIKQMSAYRWDDNKRSDGSLTKEKVFKKNDDLPDALRYALMTWPLLPKKSVIIDPNADLRNLPAEQASHIARMRNIESILKNKEIEPEDATGDFYGFAE